MSPAPVLPPSVTTSRAWRVPAAIAAATLAAVAAFIFFYAPLVRQRALADLEQELALRADERQTAIASWMSDRLDNALTMAQFPSVIEAAASDAGDEAVRGETAGHLRNVFTAFLVHRGLSAVFLIDASGRIVGTSTADPVPASCVDTARREAVGAEGMVTAHAHTDGRLAVQFIVPVGSGGARLVAQSMAADWLCPLVTQRASSRRTAEWRLVHRVGEYATWVCASQPQPLPPLGADRPMSEVEYGSAAALSGRSAYGAFLNERDEPVLAAIRPVAPAWALLLEVAEAEIDADVRRTQLQTDVAVGTLLLTLAVAAWLAWRGRMRSHDLALARTRARLANLLEQANDAILLIRPDGRVLDLNSRATTLFGGTRLQLIGRHIHDDLRPPAEREAARAAFRTLLEKGYLFYESVAQTLGGTSFPVEISSSLVQDDTGPVIVSVVRDIRGRRDAERRRDRLNRLLRTLSEVNQLLVKSEGPEDLLQGAARTIAETAGFALSWISRAESDGRLQPVASWGRHARLLDDLTIRWDDSESGRGPSALALRTQRTTVVADAIADPILAPWRDALLEAGLRSAAVSPVLVRGVPFGTVSLYSSERDAFDAETVALLERLAADLGFGLQAIEDRRQRLASEVRFRAVFDNAPLGIVVSDGDGRTLRANQVFLDLIGYTAEELQSMRFDEITHPDDLTREMPLYLETIAGQRDGYRMEKRYLRKGGREVWVAITISIVRDVTGVPAFFIVLVEDIGERRRLQEQVLQAQKMDGVGRLAGGVAHDFNNLLTAILGYAELLRDELGPGHPAATCVDEIAKAGGRAATLTSQLLAFARRQVIEPRVLDLNAVVGDAERLLRRLVGEDVEIVTALAADLGAIRADATQVHQVLINLVVNARDAMPSGGRLIVETSNATLDEDYARDRVNVAPGDYVMLAVSDTGVGMSAEVRSHLFEPFFTTKEPGRGTGLGLATCHGILAQSRGHIAVYSEEGAGTTVRVYFPRVPPEEADLEPTDAGAPALRGGTETILLAEDETSVRRLAAMSLRSYGYHVVEATDGEDALARARQHTGPLHLLVTDVVMPRMAGSELARHFAPLYPDARVLFMSGHAEQAIANRGALEPGVAFLPKPFTPERLARKVREVLDTPRPGRHDAGGRA